MDNFQNLDPGLDAPCSLHAAITPSTSPLTDVPRALWCNVAGVAVLRDKRGVELSYNLSVGVVPFRATHVLPGTTAVLFSWE